MLLAIWNWFLNFTGTNNGDNSFATHMYNFWSGFGGGLIQFSLFGALLAAYHRYISHSKVIKYVKEINPLHLEEEETAKHKKSKK